MVELDKQDPTTASDGGFQGLLVRFQKRIDRATGRLSLTLRDLQRIQMYAFKYGNGGWEDRLLRAFGRHLGSRLDKVLQSA
jgi:PleD family two-component response regulator